MEKKANSFFIVFALFFLSSAIWAQTSLSVIGTTDLDRAFSYNNGHKIARTPNNTVMTIWATEGTGPYGDSVFTAKWDETNQKWGPRMNVGLGTSRYTCPAIVSDLNSNFHAVWSDLYSVRYAMYDGTSWSEPDTVIKNAPWSEFNSNKNSITIGNNGDIFVSWSTYREANSVDEWYFISRSTDNGETWSDPDTLDKYWGTGNSIGFNAFPSLGTGPTGIVGATSTQINPGLSSYRQQYLQEWDGTSWSAPELITDFFNVCGDVLQSRLVYDSNGNRHVVFYATESQCVSGNNADNQMYYTSKMEGGTWTTPVPLTYTTDGSVSYCDISIGPEGELYAQALMNDAEGRLQIFYVRSPDGGLTWDKPTQLSQSTITLPVRGASNGAHAGPLGADVVWVQPDTTTPIPGEFWLVYGKIPVPITEPKIISIEDVPDDQGGWVTVKFNKSWYDMSSLQSTSQSLSTESYTIEMYDGTEWVALNTTGAYGKDTYSILVHTTTDSSEGSTNALISFRIIANMEEGNFVSDIAQGYSVDNLAPAVPTGLVASVILENTVQLSWSQPVDEDFGYFRVYRSQEADFDPTGMEPINETVENNFNDEQVPFGTYYYKVSSVDAHGNESEYSEAAQADIIVGVENNLDVPREYALSQNYPNPFNPVTVISYQLPEKAFVNISVFNIEGKLITTLVNESRNAGYYSVTWDAVSDRVSSGVYFYRLRSNEFISVKKALIIK